MNKGEETALLYKILINKGEENGKSPLAYSTEKRVADNINREMLKSVDESFQREWIDTISQIAPNSMY